MPERQVHDNKQEFDIALEEQPLQPADSEKKQQGSSMESLIGVDFKKVTGSESGFDYGGFHNLSMMKKLFLMNPYVADKESGASNTYHFSKEMVDIFDTSVLPSVFSQKLNAIIDSKRNNPLVSKVNYNLDLLQDDWAKYILTPWNWGDVVASGMRRGVKRWFFRAHVPPVSTFDDYQVSQVKVATEEETVAFKKAHQEAIDWYIELQAKAKFEAEMELSQEQPLSKQEQTRKIGEYKTALKKDLKRKTLQDGVFEYMRKAEIAYAYKDYEEAMAKAIAVREIKRSAIEEKYSPLEAEKDKDINTLKEKLRIGQILSNSKSDWLTLELDAFQEQLAQADDLRSLLVSQGYIQKDQALKPEDLEPLKQKLAADKTMVQEHDALLAKREDALAAIAKEYAYVVSVYDHEVARISSLYADLNTPESQAKQAEALQALDKVYAGTFSEKEEKEAKVNAALSSYEQSMLAILKKHSAVEDKQAAIDKVNATFDALVEKNNKLKVGVDYEAVRHIERIYNDAKNALTVSNGRSWKNSANNSKNVLNALTRAAVKIKQASIERQVNLKDYQFAGYLPLAERLEYAFVPEFMINFRKEKNLSNLQYAGVIFLGIISTAIIFKTISLITSFFLYNTLAAYSAVSRLVGRIPTGIMFGIFRYTGLSWLGRQLSRGLAFAGKKTGGLLASLAKSIKSLWKEFKEKRQKKADVELKPLIQPQAEAKRSDVDKDRAVLPELNIPDIPLVQVDAVKPPVQAPEPVFSERFFERPLVVTEVVARQINANERVLSELQEGYFSDGIGKLFTRDISWFLSKTRFNNFLEKELRLGVGLFSASAEEVQAVSQAVALIGVSQYATQENKTIGNKAVLKLASLNALLDQMNPNVIQAAARADLQHFKTKLAELKDKAKVASEGDIQIRSYTAAEHLMKEYVSQQALLQCLVARLAVYEARLKALPPSDENNTLRQEIQKFPNSNLFKSVNKAILACIHRLDKVVDRVGSDLQAEFTRARKSQENNKRQSQGLWAEQQSLKTLQSSQEADITADLLQSFQSSTHESATLRPSRSPMAAAR